MFTEYLNHHLDCFQQLAEQEHLIEDIGRRLATCIRQSNKILVCGNGGSAADAQHFAAELIGRFEQERAAWPAIALTTDTSILTAIANDYRFSEVFERQVDGLGQPGDVLIGISTSGNSENVLRAVDKARSKGLTTIGLLGGSGGRLEAEVNRAVLVQGASTARIQEAHIFILHVWAAIIEHNAGPVEER